MIFSREVLFYGIFSSTLFSGVINRISIRARGFRLRHDF
jgi:hypothetical protein